MISLFSAIAEFERDIIAERITDNMYELAKEGRWLGGECPLGYFSQKEKLTIGGKKTTVNHLEPVEDEQRAVKAAFEAFLRAASLTGTVAFVMYRNVGNHALVYEVSDDVGGAQCFLVNMEWQYLTMQHFVKSVV